MSKEIEIELSDVCTQRTAIMYHLKRFGNITSWEAIKEYGATRLSGIIHNLRAEGYNITTIDVKDKNRFGKSVTYAKYIYVKPAIKQANNQISLLDAIEDAEKND
jgi:hypothetical protein